MRTVTSTWNPPPLLKGYHVETTVPTSERLPLT